MKTVKMILITTVLLLLSGFRVGDGQDLIVTFDPQNQDSIDGIVRTGIMVGPISNFGSIVINGVTYSTDDASFSINEMPGVESDLDVGQTVTVRGRIGSSLLNGNAMEIFYNDNVKGPIDSVDLATGSLSILGQPISVDESTSYDESIPDGSIEGLQIGDLVEVSGLVDSSGQTAATRISAIPVGSQFEILNTIGSVNSVEQTLSINAAVIDFSTAMLEGIPGGQLQEGMLVEVQGVGFSADGELVASRVIKRTAGITGNVNDRVEIQGFVTDFASVTRFSVGSNKVKLTPDTLFEDGESVDLGLNTRLEVEGAFDAMGVIEASVVKFYHPPVIRIEAPISALDPSVSSLELLGISVEVTVETRMEDKSDQEDDPLTLQQLNLHDYVEIKGTQKVDGGFQVRATLVERNDPDERVTLQGYPEVATEPAIRILGVDCETAEAQFFSPSGEPISASEFFDQVDELSLVKVRGVQIGATSINATKVELRSQN